MTASLAERSHGLRGIQSNEPTLGRCGARTECGRSSIGVEASEAEAEDRTGFFQKLSNGDQGNFSPVSLTSWSAPHWRADPGARGVSRASEYK